jgi:DNA-binding NarL/FixJ family response regulator
MALSCFIVDDSAAFIDAAVNVLQRGGVAVVGTASTAACALQQARELDPDVILVDIMLGLESGLELAKSIADTGLRSTVILISTHSEADFADLIAETPAAGFVPKSELSAGVIRTLAGV